MKKNISYLMLMCLIMTVLIGCGKQKEEQKKDTEKYIGTVAGKLEVLKEPLAEEDVSNVEKGIHDWISAFLAVNSDTGNRELKDDALYNSIVDEHQREKLEEKRTEFYKDSTVVIEEIRVEVGDTKKAIYDKREVGIVECIAEVNGKKNDNKFNEKYVIEFVVDYIGDIVSVYEIESITW